MNVFRFITFALLVAFIVPLAAAQSRTPLPEDQLSLAETSAHLRILAADELQGRAPGTFGGWAAARYIAEQFRAAGLQTVDGADGYYHYVPLVQTTPPAGGSLTLFGTTYQHGDAMIQVGGGALDVERAVVFANYGLADDYADLEVSGKVVVTRFGAPGVQNPIAALRQGTAKRALAAEKGALALIELYNLPLPWQRLSGFLNQPRLGIDDGATLPYFWINDAEGALAERVGTAAAPQVVFAAEGLTVESKRSPNVVGFLEGHDPAKKDEYILLMAHYDHLGVRSSPATPADSIYNGARDNGMGTVALINAAKSLGAQRPARSVLFMAVTAEESGLIGSRYYAEQPLLPLEDMVFVLNNDGAGYNNTDLVTVVGLNRTTAQGAIQEAVATYGLTAVDDPAPEQNLFDRSDNVNFAAKGVPAPTFSPGFDGFTGAITTYYHQAADEADADFDFPYLLRFTQAYTRAARMIANMEERPFWIEGDTYEAAGKQLYGRD